MPTIPKTGTKALSENTPQQIVNAVRASASPFFQSNVPFATNEMKADQYWSAVSAYDSMVQEFSSILFSRIAKVVITSKLFQNPLRFLKKGEVELGEIIEEAFVNPAKPSIYNDPAVPDEAVARAVDSEIYNTFYVMNYQVDYDVTIRNVDMRKYFLSWSGVEDLIAKMTESLYTGAYLDEFLTTKYMIARKLLDGAITTVDVGDFTTDPEKAVVKIKEVSNDMTFLRTNMNEAGVYTYTNKDEQFFLVTSAFDAQESVEVQASAFNLDKVQFMGQRVLIDGFDQLDWGRLDILFKYDKNYHRFTEDELDQLSKTKIAGIIIDWYYLQIYDNWNGMDEFYNGKKVFWNYFLHAFRTFAVSPYSNAVALINGSPTITSITITPATATLNPGQGVQLTATVTGTNFASKGVTWSANSDEVTVNTVGYVFAKQNATSGSKITVTATSVQDDTKTATAEITIA